MEIYIHKTHGWQCKKINDKNKLRAMFLKISFVNLSHPYLLR